MLNLVGKKLKKKIFKEKIHQEIAKKGTDSPKKLFDNDTPKFSGSFINDNQYEQNFVALHKALTLQQDKMGKKVFQDNEDYASFGTLDEQFIQIKKQNPAKLKIHKNDI